MRFFANAPRGLARLLADELRALGIPGLRPGESGVAFGGGLEAACRVCLWSRVANRVLLPLGELEAENPEALYESVKAIDWGEHLAPTGTLAVDAAVNEAQIGHSRYAALKVKDAIVDQFRDRHGVRPSVDLARPDLRLSVQLRGSRGRIAIDLSGGSLHRRGYRSEGGEAPLKENLAAAILLLAGWPEIARQGGALVDPMCGSGTLLIEGALIAGDVAPGLFRDHFGFLGWRGFQNDLWQPLLAEAEERRAAALERLPTIRGQDADQQAVRAALANLAQAGLRGKVHVERRSLEKGIELRGNDRPGLLAVNPPYGERIGEVTALGPLYARLGALLRKELAGWRAAIFTGNPDLASFVGRRPERSETLFNGPIECRLLHYPPAAEAGETVAGGGGEQFANRLRKNLKHLGKWARREGVSCWRVYDADLPEYALAVDLYEGERRWVHVQEYQAPKSIDPEKALSRLQEALALLPELLEVPVEQVFFKRRERQKGKAQYEKLGDERRFHEVREGACRLLVNFTDYLDTGLFLDHRPVRALIGELARGRSFLNLFAYTGAATVHAALGGATATTTVDLSHTYLEWAGRNLRLNGLNGPEHELIHADCRAWLELEARRGRRKYGLIFLDPPTFSNSKRMEGSFDVQRDHVALIRDAAALLEPGGVLLFSNNFRRFKLDGAALAAAGLELEEITRATIPPDFARDANIHRCWRIGRHGAAAV